MSCDLDKKTLSAYIDDELDEKSRSLVYKHLKSCPRCRKRLEQFSSLQELSFALRNIKAPYYLTRKTIDYIEDYKTTPIIFGEKILRRSPLVKTCLVSFLSLLAIFITIISFKLSYPTKDFERLALFKNQEIAGEKSYLTKESNDEGLVIVYLQSNSEKAMKDKNLYPEDVAMMFNLQKEEKRKVFDSVIIFNDSSARSLVESHFDW